MPDLSQLPSIDRLLRQPEVQEIIQTYGRPLTLTAIRTILDDLRQAAIQEDQPIPTNSEILELFREQLEAWLAPTLVPVINASGVILHTNLGRAPLSRDTRQAISEIGAGYSNLEFNLDTGKRGKRSMHAGRILSLLTGAEDGFVVNNNAGAVLLTLSALARGGNVLVSRTQLVEIGGGFRIPDVMRQSGATLVEIGTTNRVHLRDFEQSLTEDDIALVLIAHHSNFKLIGFHSEPELAEIVEVAHRHGVPVVHDIGSGALMDTAEFGLAHEPTVQESLAAGCDLVCFSGDKLLGGPQAGIIIGKQDLLAPIKTHPLARALRAGKLTLTGVSATLQHYLKNEALSEVPIWQMIALPLDTIHARAEHWKQILGFGEVQPGKSTVGGGSLPTEEMPTFTLTLAPAKPDESLRALREVQPPIIARIENDQVLFDPRTVLPEQEELFLQTLKQVWNATSH
ncbi:MAG: L-seryl-tRNA(Sec) selenium transferase [Anaerolineaceae bacterium]|nr:L-seryl-tRNA(Sec) selenium transferase [Anaerolineaceae bacterium]